MTVATQPGDLADRAAAAHAAIRRRTWITAGAFGLIIAYLAYAWVAFEVPALIRSADPGRGVLLATDSVAHKVHVTRDLRRGGMSIAVEGERRATFDAPPPWVERTENGARIDLGEGYIAEMEGRELRFTVPGYGTIEARAGEERIHWSLPEGPVPEWLSLNERKLEARPTLDRRVKISRARIEVHNYFFGWENFWFPFDSELNAYSWGELAALALGGDRLSPDMSNAAYIFDTFWTNPGWQHGHVFTALLETILMAVLGTFTATFVGLPLAFLAARNFTPSLALRFAVRRVFDFVRGIDNLIWSLIFIRAFGLGPLTGALAIALTDTGTLGKLFSEALENVDNRQVEGVRATGASQLQRYRYGVIPQILPVFISQGLYYLESNTRSATVIGALGAGGIGLVLVETMRTSRDWENTLYIISLTVAVVVLMDSVSSWLRRKLITGV